MESVIFGRWTEERLSTILREAAEIQGAGERIAFLSEKFLGLPYQEKTLIGDIKTPEVFVINLSAVDCFTFIDYIEAMRLSSSFSEFRENLRRVRYKSGKIAFENRNHFFTDWVESNSEFVEDVTEEIGSKNAIKVEKMINAKEDGTYFLNGIDLKERVVKYIPSVAIDDSTMNKLRTGDYAGIYSDAHGLDVSHVGIIIKDSEGFYLRHASSVQRKVVDEDFRDYIANKPGIVILRPK
ncbi:MAG: N-acetylmuramoyl-L-alanine amidase-like domain-containing protein [Nitrospirota bacterium]